MLVILTIWTRAAQYQQHSSNDSLAQGPTPHKEGETKDKHLELCIVDDRRNAGVAHFNSYRCSGTPSSSVTILYSTSTWYCIPGARGASPRAVLVPGMSYKYRVY